MNAQEIQVALLKINTLEELKEINETLGFRWKALQKQQAKAFRPGDKVTFKGKGVVYSGVVEKVNQKTVAVKTGPYQTWRVSPGMLKKVA